MGGGSGRHRISAHLLLPIYSHLLLPIYFQEDVRALFLQKLFVTAHFVQGDVENDVFGEAAVWLGFVRWGEVFLAG